MFSTTFRKNQCRYAGTPHSAPARALEERNEFIETQHKFFLNKIFTQLKIVLHSGPAHEFEEKYVEIAMNCNTSDQLNQLL